MRYALKYLNNIHKIEVKKEDSALYILIDRQNFVVKNIKIKSNQVSFQLNNKRYCVYGVLKDRVSYISIDGEYYTLELADEKRQKRDTSTGGDSVASPMPGLVVKIAVKVGEKVTAGTTLAIVEAMKMQNELRAPRDGMIKKINFKEGEQIDAFEPIVELS